eukprot:1874256-Heterocapsa_arctica.AAC.1
MVEVPRKVIFVGNCRFTEEEGRLPPAALPVGWRLGSRSPIGRALKRRALLHDSLRHQSVIEVHRKVKCLRKGLCGKRC